MRRRSGAALVGRLTVLALWLLLQGTAAADRGKFQAWRVCRVFADWTNQPINQPVHLSIYHSPPAAGARDR